MLWQKKCEEIFYYRICKVVIAISLHNFVKPCIKRCLDVLLDEAGHGYHGQHTQDISSGYSLETRSIFMQLFLQQTCY